MEFYKILNNELHKTKNFLPNFLVRKFTVNPQFSQILGYLALKSVETVPDHLQKIFSPGNSRRISAL